jgi:Spy/CpxP family protein refolding chaperone
MKTFSIVALLCCSMLFPVASAQELTPEQVQQQIEQQLQRMQSPRQQIHWEADQLVGTRSTWNGQGAFIPLGIMLRAGGEAELGLTEEQKQQFASIYRGEEMGMEVGLRLRENPPPEFIQAMEAVQAAQLPNDPLFERATEEQKTALREATMRQLSFLVGGLQTLVEETLTPEQMLQVRKLEMQLMPGIPFPSDV